MSSVVDTIWFGPPRASTILFLTEMWELVPYDGMPTPRVHDTTRQSLFAQANLSFISLHHRSFPPCHV